MMTPTLTEQCETLTKRCRQQMTLIESGLAEPVECWYTLIVTLVNGPETCWPECLAELSDELSSALFDYAQDFLEGSDFMPSPDIFLAGTPAESEIEAKRQELRPKYQKLFEEISRRAGVCPAG